MNTIKQIIGCLTIATSVTVACYFLPIVNALFGDYLFGFFLAAFVVPLGIKGYETHRVKVNAMSEAERHQRQQECDAYHEEESEAMTCPTYCYDNRNIDQQLHIFNGLKD